jgi:tetratricopeptide (TPR) repeat protein
VAPKRERGFQPGYTVSDVAKILGLTPAQVRGYIRSGFLKPRRGKAREYRFGIQDLVLLRTAKELSASIPEKRVKKALRSLEAKLPRGRPLSGVRITAVGDAIAVRDGRALWRLDSGQGILDFEVDELTSRVAPLARRAAEAARVDESRLDAEDWYALGFDLEACDPIQARDAYRRALELDPGHQSARVNLGRLLQEAGHPERAIAHYRLALAAHPGDATAAFNLGVALEDLKKDAEAAGAYEQALSADPRYADAYYNLARLYERTGKAAAAFRLLKAYRSLIQG